MIKFNNRSRDEDAATGCALIVFGLLFGAMSASVGLGIGFMVLPVVPAIGCGLVAGVIGLIGGVLAGFWASR